MDKNEKDGVLYADPTDLAGRTAIASSCVANLGIEFPALVDSIDNRTEIAYTAWPERIYLIGADGKVILKSKPGPFGFEPDDLKTELERLFRDVPELPEEDEGEAEAEAEDEASEAIPPLLK